MTHPFTALSAFTPTPGLDTGRVGTDALALHVAHAASAGAASVGVLGSTGGYPYLSRPERARAIAAGVEAAGPTPVLAGIGALTQDEVLGCAQDAQAAGAAGLLLAAVSYLPPTEDEVAGLFQTVSDATDLPILIYDNPGTTGVAISDALLARLLAIPRVGGAKSPPAPNGDFAGALAARRAASPGASLGFSGDAFAAPAIAAGCDAFYSVLAGMVPRAMQQQWDSGGTDDAPLAPLMALAKRHGTIRLAYGAAPMLGLPPAALPAPLRPLPDDALDELDAALSHAGG
ncbi:MAG: dihydrodipicolinate synthase family protein [Paracoccaceae bacterium]